MNQYHIIILPSKGFPHQKEQFTTLNCLERRWRRKVKREDASPTKEHRTAEGFEVRKELFRSSGPSSSSSRMPRTMSRWFMNISKDGESTASLRLCQCSVTLTEGKNVSWCSEGTSCVSLPLVLSLLKTAWLYFPFAHHLCSSSLDSPASTALPPPV